jgi:outer membrane biosynthesis protein TonB
MSPTPEDLRDEWLRLLIASEDANAAQGDAYAVMASAYRRKHIEDVLASGELLTPRSLERIEVPNLTDPETIARYNELRGYTTEPEPTPTPEPEPEPEPEEAPEAPAEPEAPATKPEAVEE